MKILSSDKFNHKVSQLDARIKKTILDFIMSLQEMNSNDLLRLSKKYIERNVYVYRLGDYRIFFTIDKEVSGEDVVILVDLIHKGYNPQIIYARHPRFNGSINPHINGSINPRINGSINPLINGSINPLINGSINPLINGSINPLINGSINPRINGSINPAINGSINPLINGSINPNINPSFDGYYLYDLDLAPQEFIIEANINILLFYNFELKNIKFGVKHSNAGFVVFNTQNNWVGHIESNGSKGFNSFDLQNHWTGIVV